MKHRHELVLVVFFCINSALARPPSQSFGEYYPHTRWADIQTGSIIVDAYANYLVISEPGKPPITILGKWDGRTFSKRSDHKSFIDFFSVALEGSVGTFLGDKHLFDKGEFKRLRPDPKRKRGEGLKGSN
jgi:hypothetical protein